MEKKFCLYLHSYTPEILIIQKISYYANATSENFKNYGSVSDGMVSKSKTKECESTKKASHFTTVSTESPEKLGKVGMYRNHFPEQSSGQKHNVTCKKAGDDDHRRLHPPQHKNCNAQTIYKATSDV